MTGIRISVESPSKKDIASLQTALTKINLKIDPQEIKNANLGQSTRDALSKLQSRTGLTADGILNLGTVEKLNIELEHVYYASNKNRTSKIQSMLERLGYKLDPEEIKARTFGKSTEETLKSFQSKMEMQPDGFLKNELIGKLKEQDLKKRLESSNQVSNIQHTLLRAGRIAKLGLSIETGELKQKNIGPSTRAFIGAFQNKYGLPQTGELDLQTLERIKSVAASRPVPVKALKFKSAADLKPIKNVLRLNMTSKHVGTLQQSLAYLGYKIDEAEFKNKSFGKTTREAVMAYQRTNSLPVIGHVESETLSSLNDKIKAANPQAFELNKSYRIRGTVRNELWIGQVGLKVRVYEKLLRGTGPMLAERQTGTNGFFDIPYNPPRNPTDGKIKTPFHLLIKVFNETSQELFSPGKVLFNPTLISWINFTAGNEPYRGVSEFESYMKSISKVLGTFQITEIEETDDVQEITHVAINSGLSPEEVMRLALSHRVALNLKNQFLGPEFFYAFIRQNLPPYLPDDALISTEGWSEQLMDMIVNGVVFMDSELQAQAFENAVQNNLIPIAISVQKEAILSALADQKQHSALEKPILVGNGSLSLLLSASSIPQEKDNYNNIANAFLKHQGFGVEFWDDVKANANNLGGSDAVQDFETTVELGHITKNHIPTLKFLKDQIASPAEKRLKSTRDLAKLTMVDWVKLIKANGSQVPPGTDGSDQDKINVFASTLVSQSERLFPTVAFCSKVSTSSQHGLQKLPSIQEIIDKNPELNLRTSNIDKYIHDNNLNVTDETRSEIRVMQRVNRLAPTAETGLAMLELKIHNSSQVVSLGRERFISALAAKNIDKRIALTIYGYAEFQYAQVLMRLADYRSELHLVDPAAIVRHTYTAEEQKELLKDIPDLETLFGPLDFCDCKHCQSVYGPPAYLADLLRFLQSHDSEQVDPTEPNAYRKVLDILFDRRPDIGNIKLNCDNTETPLPYTDLVCEILENAIPAPVSDVLENAIPAPVSDANFNYQTTRTSEELNAFPENVRRAAYDELKKADFPINGCFNLWQEEARIFLTHLGVKRYELMDLFQLPPTGDKPIPSDVSIAGEFWGISSHETEIIITQAATKEEQDNFWGFENLRTKIKVLEFLEHAKIEYYDLLALLEVKWLNPSGAANPVYIPPGNEQMLKEQELVNLTVAKFDKIHRLLRLWKHTDWELWEIDLLIRAPHIGNGNLDAQALVQIKQFKQIQELLKLGFEEMLSFYSKINTELRIKPGEPSKIIQPLYVNLFQNPAVTNPIDKKNPVDEKFAYDKLDPDSKEKLEDHRTTLLAALALTEADLALLLKKTDGKLTLDNLTILLNYANLAHALNYTIKDLLTLLDLTKPDVGDIFASPKKTLDFLERQERIKESGFEIQELDYLLNDRSDSPYGLREDTITQYISTLRDSLRSRPTDMKDGQISSQIASTFSLTNEQADLLIRNLNLQQLTDNKLTEKDDKGRYITIKPKNFPRIYTAYRLLHKASLLVNHYKITSKEDLEWLLTKPTVYNGIDFKTLPVGKAPKKSLFRAWLNLNNWLYFQSQHPQPEGITWRRIFDKARKNNRFTVANVRTDLSKLTTWDVDDLKELDLDSKAVYLDMDTYMRLSKCFKQLKRLGVNASMVLDWAKRDNDIDDAQFIAAQQIRQAAKSKYDYTVWLSRVKPLQDELRKNKRTALISYLIENSLRTEKPEINFNGKQYANPKYWRDANDLLSYFLIDVEMSACQLTSRIKQAISSVQMFVQRSFLNLEQPYVQVSREEKEDKVSMNSWKQWEWMKSYRIWEANRKVFLYPENWIEPELRDDKSPFFEEFENEILQSEITHENCEAAFLNYLEKVNEVSRLEIVGIYHEFDDANPYEDDLLPDISVLHVVGRTRSQPAVYYYRQFDLNYNSWTAWEKIDLDITGDHVIPVVYNRKLHLFWLIFTEKPQKVKKQPPVKSSDSPTDAPEPPKLLEIQLAWSVRKGKGWSSRKVAPQKLIHPWERPHFSYNLKPRYKGRENLLWLDIYISTSQEFNNALFYDPYKTNNGNICKASLTAVRYDETIRPWHSSSFVFDGSVVDLKLKALAGQYHILGSNGYASEDLVKTTSYQYVHDNFYQGTVINKLSGPYDIAPRLVLPEGMHFQNTRVVNNKKRFNANRLNILAYSPLSSSSSSQTLLNGAISPFEIVCSQHHIQLDITKWEASPLFYQDYYRSFFIKPEWQTVIQGYNHKVPYLQCIFYPFYHPYTALFIRELNRSGLEGLLNRGIQLYPHTYYPSNNFSFNAIYGPTSLMKADKTAESDIIDFSFSGAYSIYNWEIFFHAPLLVASKLSQNQRFEEAMRWFHYIFDPTNTEALSVPQRYWVTKPFFEQNSENYRKQRIENILKSMGTDSEELRAWKNNPFKPHLIARYRPVAYQKNVVMKYIDNLISWGDQLFRRDTLESINEATMLYVLAYELLGRRPIKVPNTKHRDYTYNQLTADSELDPFGNKRVDVLLENFTYYPKLVIRTPKNAEPLPKLDVFYFGIPANDKLLSYWNTVEDRLFKIRHCANIEGVVRQLPLFEPPIDPALLVKAAAAGIDLSSVLNDAATTAGQYRFRLLASRAVEFCNEVRTLGEKVLSMLERKDAEGLSLLQSLNQVELLKAVTEVKKQQIEEAHQTWAGLEKGLDVLEKRIEYYNSIPRMNEWETAGVVVHGLGIVSEIVATVLNTVAGTAHLFPRITVGASGFGGTPVATEETGGDSIGKSSATYAALFQGLSSILHQSGQMLEAQGGYTRRDEENKYQTALAEKEKIQLNKQIEAARIRYLITEKELENHELQIEQVESADEYMRSKYTNQQLYDWMLKQLATVYFQSYQLAYDLAKRAEKSYQFELGQPNASFIQFGYWDSLKKGLLAGEKLVNDIHRMEMSYYEQNKRELEITKHISLAQYMPLSLLTLKATGSCTVTLPEWLFDLDYPGHYRRRIKSVSITIPCIVGPYTNVNCTLSLIRNGVRLTDDVGVYGDPLDANDTRFNSNFIPLSYSIATSNGQNDAGVFELNFNDERYMPFEGAGAVSEWTINLPKENNLFDVATVSDVILHIRYTSAASSKLKEVANKHLEEVLPKKGCQLFALEHDFSNEWYRFFNPIAGQDQVLTLNLKADHMPFWVRARSAKKILSVDKVDLIIDSTHVGDFEVKLKLPGVDIAEESMQAGDNFGDMKHMVLTGLSNNKSVRAIGDWNFTIKKVKNDNNNTIENLKKEDIAHAYLLIQFSMNKSL